MNRSVFPTQIDVFTEHFDIQSSDIPNVKRYQELKMKTVLSPTEQVELANLTALLKEKLFTPEDLNKLQDAITNLETFFRDNVEGYIDNKQTQYNAYIDDKTSMFDSKLNRFAYRGEYSHLIRYYQWNYVTHSGEGYLAKQDSRGHMPIGDETDVYWLKTGVKGVKGEKGDQGIEGVGLNFKGSYDILENYDKDDLVTYDGSTWACIQAVSGETPSTSSQHWKLFVAKGGSTVLARYENQVIIGSATANVSIGISQYNVSRDSLLVFRNGTKIFKGKDFSLNPNGISIDKLGTPSTWDTGTVFDFVVDKNVSVDGSTQIDGTNLFEGSVGFPKLDVSTRNKINNAEQAINDVVTGAPAALNTFKKLASAIGNDPNYSTTIASTLSNKLDSSKYTATDVLAKIKTVDGTGSGLDAELLNGQHSSYYLAASAYNANDVLAKLKTVHGSGSGLGADLLDGFHADDFVKAVGMGTSGNTVPGGSWDNAITTGFYMSSSATSAPPFLPGSNNWFIGLVSAHNSDWVVQTLTDLNNVAQWTRSRANKIWGSWKRIVRDDMIRVNKGKLEFFDNGEWKPAGLGGAEGVPVGYAETTTTWSKWTQCNDGVNTFAPYKDKLYCIEGSNLKKVELSDMSTLKTAAVSSPRSLAVYNDRIYVYSYANNYSVFVYDLDLNPLYNKSISMSFSAIAVANGAFYGVDSYGAISYFSLDLNLVRTVPRTGSEYFYTKLVVGPNGNLYYDYYSGNSTPYTYSIKKFDPQLNVIGNYSIANYNVKWAVTATGTIGIVYKNGSWSDDPYYIGYIRPDGTRNSYNTNNTNLGSAGAGLNGGFYVFVNNTLDLYSDEGVPMVSTKYKAYNSSDYNFIVPDSLGGVLALDRGSSDKGYLYRVMTKIKFNQP
ncbi:pyocin knob domain-containing protein [Paenibacillus chitinolyticus]|uniref:pyocin knob domain-containing protein n=1 Tax=Paenibacillus chitinolyticus TaxID=79263 RepID=UPI003D071C22